jgi:hypothetical protein
MSTNPHHSLNSLRSAEVVVPLVHGLVHPTSVVDFGCKHGEWLSGFRRAGVVRVVGYDQQTRADRGLLISPAEFRVADLNNALVVSEKFDLAVCIEVAEHLRKSAAEPLVATLTSVAPVVLFSAALPGQGGHGHLNEQLREYWHELFEKHGCKPIDCLRPRIWQDSRVAYWYRQNMFLYVSAAAVTRYPGLNAQLEHPPASDLELIHVDVLKKLTVNASLGGGLARLFAFLGRKISSTS